MSDNDQGIYLLDILAFTGASAEIIRVGSRDYVTAPDDAPGNTKYEGRLINAGELKRLMFENGGTVGRPQPNQGFFEISNADHALDSWLDYRISGWDFWLYYLESQDAAYSSKTLAFKGTMRGFTSDALNTSFKIRIRDKLETVDRPLLTERYSGTTTSTGATAEGDSSMNGTFKPYSIGRNLQIQAAPANSFDLIYQVSITAQEIIRPSDGGDVLTSAGNYTTLALLDAATTGALGSGAAIEAGEYATCLSAGLGRLGAKAAKAVSWEVYSSTSNSNLSAGAVAKQILLDGGVSSSDIDDASFAAMVNTSGRFNVGLYITDDKSVLEAACQALNSIGATIVGTRDGKLKAVSIGTIPTDFSPPPLFSTDTVVDTFTNDDLSLDSQFSLRASPNAEGDGVRAYGVNIKWAPRDYLLSAGDLNGDVSPANARLYGTQYIQTSDGDLSILDEEPLAQLLEFETRLVDGTGAIIQSQWRFEIYGKRRDYIQFSVSMTRAGDLEIGDIIVVKPTDGSGNPIYGYGADGKRGCIIGRWDKFSSRTVIFYVFVAVE